MNIGWKQILENEISQPYFRKLWTFVKSEYDGPVPVYPAKEDIFNAFKQCPFSKTRVVILGQDPYHTPGAAHGLSFSVRQGMPHPPSLENILAELESEYPILPTFMRRTGDLTPWARQGVLLLNTSLTVREGIADSHKGRGWEVFTQNILGRLVEHKEAPVVFVCWGAKAKQAYSKAIGLTALRSKSVCISSPHPSPLSAYRGFFGSKPFSKVNYYLEQSGQEPINW